MNSALKCILRTLEYAQDDAPFFRLVKMGHIVIINDRKIYLDGHRSDYSYHAHGRPCAVIAKKQYSASFVPGSHKKKGRSKHGRWNHQSDPFTLFVPKNTIPGMDKDGWFLIRYGQTESAEFFNRHAYKGGSRIPDPIFRKLLNKVNEWFELNYRNSYD